MWQPRPGCDSMLSVPPSGRDPLGEVVEPGAALHGGRVEADAVVLDRESDRPSTSLMAIVTDAPRPACLAAFCRHSRQQK